MDLQATQLLNSMKGVAYLLDADGTIVAVGRHNWNSFARENGAAAITDGAGIIGRSLFDFIAGDTVRATWARAFDGIVHRRRGCGRIAIRCDSPTLRRDLLVMLTPVFADGGVNRVLVQSLTLNETARPAIGLFDFSRLLQVAALDPSLPILAMCSFCQNVRHPAGADEDEGDWVTAEAYYRRGGSTRVRISHGLCPVCYEREAASLAA
jgi:hypothetical protein